MRTQWIVWLALLGPITVLAAPAAPFTPAHEAEVLERVPAATGDSEIRRLQAALRSRPNDLDQALLLAWEYVKTGRTESEPRYYGYAQAALAPWWESLEPPPQVLLLRATVRQSRHDFAGALADLEQVLKSAPRTVQAWLARAVILTVVGDYPAAAQSCVPLSRLASALVALLCRENINSLTGRAEASIAKLQQGLALAPINTASDERRWALTVLAESAARLGQGKVAEDYFRQALARAQRDGYALGAYADWLLDQNRPEAVLDLLKDETRNTGLLARLALAAKRAQSPKLKDYLELLNAQLQAVRLRGEQPELATSAYVDLYLFDQPGTALQSALANWQRQREPRDAQLVLAAALAAGAPRAAQTVLDWIRQTGLQDVSLQSLAERLGVAS